MLSYTRMERSSSGPLALCNTTHHRFISRTCREKNPRDFLFLFLSEQQQRAAVRGSPAWPWEKSTGMAQQEQNQESGQAHRPQLCVPGGSSASSHSFHPGTWGHSQVPQQQWGAHRAPALVQVHVQAVLYHVFKSIVLDVRSTLHFIRSQYVNI